MNTNNTFTLPVVIDQIVPGGLGLGRVDGRVVLVPLAAMGDHCTVTIQLGEQIGQVDSVETPGPDRVEPACPHYGECGGCDFMHLSYEGQLQAKVGMIEDALRRTAKLQEWPAIAIVASPEPLANRVRATWRPSPDGGAGYFRRDSHEVIDIRTCPILEPTLEARRKVLAPRDVVQALTNGRDVSLAEGDDEAGSIQVTVNGVRYLARADVFFQANGALLDQFTAFVVEAAAPQADQRVHDLYCGLGLFSVPLARLAGTVDGIDVHEPAILLGMENARLNAVTNCAFQAMSVENWLRHCPPAGVTVIDPPRAGLSKATAALLPGKVRHRLIYVSCDPVTFARDARRLMDHGLRLTGLTAFDMFPQTHHVELVATFEKSARSRRRERASRG